MGRLLVFDTLNLEDHENMESIHWSSVRNALTQHYCSEGIISTSNIRFENWAYGLLAKSRREGR